ncbi:unnamed protein product [Paramecium octaurelia]|uniref:Uncharacterized protein n=1 Tax=Paramecium octaurelia TaxID=43137 RepID=A0A8S1SR71_PAROT|nr:unnamed protein product [Paramecium octaurelia]
MKKKLYKDFVQIWNAKIQDLSSVYNVDQTLRSIKIVRKIQTFITKFSNNILELATDLIKSFAQAKIKYEQFSKQLKNMKIKQWYQYLNNQEEIMKQDQIGTQLVKMKTLIQPFEIDKGQQQLQVIKHDVRIRLFYNLNQESNYLIHTNGRKLMIKLLNTQVIRETKIIGNILQKYFFNGNELTRVRNNYEGIGQKINDKLYRDLLDYTDQELIETPSNCFILIAKSQFNFKLQFMLQNEERNFKKLLRYAKRF